jgi:DNA-binding response OmpR family regulator
MFFQHYADGGRETDGSSDGKNGNGSRRVLVVSSDLGTRLYLGVVLKRIGFEVVEAVNAAAVLAGLHEVQPDLIIIDMATPDRSGLELYRQVRARPDTSHHRVLGITSRGRPYHDAVAGADTCLTKPILSDDLIAKIHDVLDDREQRM